MMAVGGDALQWGEEESEPALALALSLSLCSLPNAFSAPFPGLQSSFNPQIFPPLSTSSNAFQ